MYFPQSKKCSQCGCTCDTCYDVLDYHHRIEELTSKLSDAGRIISKLENQIQEVKLANQLETNKKDDEFAKLKDRYERLSESHRHVNKQNQILEENLLTVVASYEKDKEKRQLDLQQANNTVQDLLHILTDMEKENLQCRTDCNLAVQLLQHNPSDYVSHRLGALPRDIQLSLVNWMQFHSNIDDITSVQGKQISSQTSVSGIASKESFVTNDSNATLTQQVQKSPNKKVSKSRMPMLTFPPTAMMFEAPASPPAQNLSPDSSFYYNRTENVNSKSTSDFSGFNHNGKSCQNSLLSDNMNYRQLRGDTISDDMKICNTLLSKVLKNRMFCDVTNYNMTALALPSNENIVAQDGQSLCNNDIDNVKASKVIITRLLQLEYICQICDRNEIKQVKHVEQMSQTDMPVLFDTSHTGRMSARTRRHSRSASCDCDSTCHCDSARHKNSDAVITSGFGAVSNVGDAAMLSGFELVGRHIGSSQSPSTQTSMVNRSAVRISSNGRTVFDI